MVSYLYMAMVSQEDQMLKDGKKGSECMVSREGNPTGFPIVPENAVDEYKKQATVLLEMVNSTVQSHYPPDTTAAGDPINLMTDNHRNHLLLMSNAMVLRDFDFLIKNMMWAYRTYQARGFSSDYFRVVNRAFYHAVQNTLKKEDAAPIMAIYDWMLAQHESMLSSQPKGESMYSFPDDEWEEVRTRFTAALLAGDTRQPMQVAHEQVMKREHLKDFYLQVIQPALVKVGELWETAEISVAQEHLASAIVTRVMASLYPRFISLEQTKGKAIVTAAPNEFHEIGPRMVADLLEVDGWDVDYYGANVPAEDIVREAINTQPFFIAVSVSMPFNLDRSKQLIQMVRNVAALNSVKIMVGGRCFNEYPQLLNDINADGSCHDAGCAVKLAEKWWENA